MFIKIHKRTIASVVVLTSLIAATSISALQSSPISLLSTSIAVQVNSSANDAEERLTSGNVDLSSATLELGEDNNTTQLVGLRFTNVAIPPDAIIVNAYLEFEVAQVDSVSTSLTIQGQSADNAPVFVATKADLSTRSRTGAQVAWNNISAWSAANAKWQTPNLSSIVQELVNRSNWATGNAIVIIISGTGQRTAKSYDAAASAAPKLYINYTLPTPTPNPTQIPTLTPVSGAIRFTVIGDYGDGGQEERDVADRVKSWNPDFIITTGDNNYPDGAASTIDEHIGQFYHQFIYPYKGAYGPGATTNRFFPTLGNHDWATSSAQAYLDYFTLPGNERYYDYVWGPVHFFAIDSDDREPDGNLSTSIQANWLQNRLKTSTSTWNLVYMHHAPYSSGAVHPSTVDLQWPYAAWGADAVLAAHSHNYERIFQDGIVYFVNGLGGDFSHAFGTPITGSQVRYNGDFGAMLVEADTSQITFEFITRAGVLIDSYTVQNSSGTPTPIPSAFSKANPSDGVTDQTTKPSLSWGISSNTSYYEYCIDTTNNSSCDSAWVNNGTGTGTSLSNLNPATSYYWQVRAVNNTGTTTANNGAWWTFTTLPCYTLTNTSNPVGGGGINANPAPDCKGGTQYTSGAIVQLTAWSNTNYAFRSWSGDISALSNPVYVAITANRSVTANFVDASLQTFEDVPPNYWAWTYIERVYSAEITAGCSTSPLLYCPTSTVTRDQMAIFLLRGKHRSNYVPPAATGVFQDVPTTYWAADWIEQLAAEGITSGCSINPKLYCPTNMVTRDQMAVFLLRAEHGSNYVPPKATGIFQDVPTSYWAADWIEQLAGEGITGGCGSGNYCPSNPVTRDQMAVFLVKIFNLP